MTAFQIQLTSGYGKPSHRFWLMCCQVFVFPHAVLLAAVLAWFACWGLHHGALDRDQQTLAFWWKLLLVTGRPAGTGQPHLVLPSSCSSREGGGKQFSTNEKSSELISTLTPMRHQCGGWDFY